MTPNLQHLPPDVAARLREFHRRKQMLRATRVVLFTALLYAAMILIATHIDRFIFLSTSIRHVMLWAIHGVTTLIALAGFIWLNRRRETPRQIAYELEHALGHTREEVATLESVLARGGETGEIAADLVRQLESSTLKVTRGYRAGKLVRDPLTKRLGFVASAAAIYLIGLSLIGSYQFTLMIARFYHPDQNLPRPSFIKLEVTPNKAILGKGAEAVIQARVIDQTPAFVNWISQAFNRSTLNCEINIAPWQEDEKSSQDPAPTQSLKMVRVRRDLYLFTKPDLQEGFAYQVRCGNAQTTVEHIRVATQPRILDLRLTAKSPSYASLPDQVITDFSQPHSLLPGTTIEFSFRIDQPIEHVLLRQEKAAAPIAPDWDSATLTAHYKFVLKNPVTYEIDLANSLGFANLDRAMIRLGILEDAPPTVRLDQPPQEVDAIAGSLVELRGQAEDDLGLAEVGIRYVLNPDPERESTPREVAIPLANPGVKQSDIAATLDLEKIGVVPGDTLAVELRARDTNGADGLSRGIVIHVMPFTRGDDERRRLAALHAVSQLLSLAGDEKTDAATQPSVLTFDADSYRSLVKSAADTGVELNPEPSIQSLFDLLECEHYFTAEPRHQCDVRMLSAILQSDAAPLLMDANGVRSTLRADLPVIQRTLTSLILYRRTRNLLWRLAGMRDEATRLRDMLRELAAVEKVPAEAMQRVDRRGALYLAALQDIGTELIDLAKAGAKINVDSATQLVGDINETGYLLSKGALTRRTSAANRIGAQITTALELTRDAMPALITRDADARRELASLYTARFTALAAGPRDGANADRGRAAAHQWIQADRLRLEREPFAPFGRRILELAIERRLDDVANADMPALVKLGNESTVLLEDRAISERLALAWRLQSIAQSPGVSEVERSMEATLVAAEYIVNASDSRATLATSLDAVAKMPVQASEAATASMESAIRLATANISSSSERDNYRQVALLAEKILPTDAPQIFIQECLHKADSVAQLLALLDESLTWGVPDAQQKNLTALIAALRIESNTMQSALDSMAMRLLRLPGADNDGDAIVLRFKDQLMRYQQRSRPAIVSIASAANDTLSSTSLGEVKSQIARLRVLHESLQKGVAKLDQPGGAAPGDSVAASLERSSSLARAALGSGDDGSPAAVRATLARLSGIGAAVIGVRADSVDEARRAAADAFHSLEASPPDITKIRDSILRSQDSLSVFELAASRLGAASIPASVAQHLSVAKADVQQLTIPDTLDAPAISRLRLSLSEWIKKLDALAGAVKVASTPSEEVGPDFLGGPERAWALRSGYEAQIVRNRLKAIGRIADARIIDGLLSSLDPKASANTLDRAYAWSAMRYRLDRSELADVGVSRTAPKAAGKVSDPAIEFLKAELGKAKQQQKLLTDYSESTRAILDLIGDYLLY